MIAQWDSSLSVLPVAWLMIAQWDSSLSVLPVARLMIAQWDSSLSALAGARVQFPATAITSRDFPLADHMHCLVHSSGSTKERSGPPLKKSLQSHEDHQKPTDQPGLRQKIF